MQTARHDSQWRKDVDRERWPSFEILPTTPWNYGLMLDPSAVEQSFTVQVGDWPEDDYPFTAAQAPVRLKCKARRIPEWELDSTRLCAPLQDSPVYSRLPDETITLLPMGAARLRISAFPEVLDDRNLRGWRPQSPRGL